MWSVGACGEVLRKLFPDAFTERAPSRSVIHHERQLPADVIVLVFEPGVHVVLQVTAAQRELKVHFGFRCLAIGVAEFAYKRRLVTAFSPRFGNVRADRP